MNFLFIKLASCSITRELAQKTLPMIGGVLSIMSFQLIDSAFISMLGVTPLAAQGVTIPFAMVIIGIQVGLGIACTALISRYRGAKQDQQARETASITILLGLASVTVICNLLWWGRAPLLGLFTISDTIIVMVEGYWPIWLVSSWVGAALYFVSSVFRANGNTKLPGLALIFSSLINIVLDPIFIFTLDMGLEGAAIASLFAYIICTAWLCYRARTENWFSFSLSFTKCRNSLFDLLKIMLPATINQLLPPLVAILTTMLIANFGTTAVASWTLITRFELLSLVVILALTMSMPPMVGRLLGEGKLESIDRLVKTAVLFVLALQVVLAFTALLFNSYLSPLMSNDPQVQESLMYFLSFVPFCYGPLGVCMLIVSVSNALGQPKIALWLSMCRLFVFYLPAIWIGAELAQLEGVYISIFIANTSTGVVACLLYKKCMEKVSLSLQPLTSNG